MAVSCAKYRQRLDAQLANERTSRFLGAIFLRSSRGASPLDALTLASLNGFLSDLPYKQL